MSIYSTIKTLLWAILATGLLVLLVVAVIPRLGTCTQYSAYEAAKNTVRGKINTASTAEFPGLHSGDVYFYGSLSDSAIIQFYVDRQNDYGTYIRYPVTLNVRCIRNPVPWQIQVPNVPNLEPV